jgi:4'-phosphopantetheinyl transferase
VEVPNARLAAHDVHLWFLPREQGELDKLCRDGQALLSREERIRQGAMANTARARRYLLGRVLLRRALATHLSCHPAELVIGLASSGKLSLEGAEADGLDFCLSHSRGETVLVLAQAEGVGIDIEPCSRAAQVLEIARRFFAGEERDHLEQLGAAAKEEALCLWTLKESVVKAMGSTIWQGLAQVSLSIAGEELSWRAPPPQGAADDWLLALGHFRRDHRIAVALWRRAGFRGVLSWKTHVLGQGEAVAGQFVITAATVA